MRVTVIGCGRWGSFIALYLDGIGHDLTLYGRENSANMRRLAETRGNDYITLPQSIRLTTEPDEALEAETIVISIDSQNLSELAEMLASRGMRDKTAVLCMKGIEIGSTRRLSQVMADSVDGSNRVAVWLGPGHVQQFCAGIPNFMVIDSDCEKTKRRLADEFSGGLIRFYYGNDMIGNEIGAAAKNVTGIAAGMLDGMGMTAVKGALMSRGTREVARLISAMGGNELCAYGLCHLGDYEATVFSPFSRNRNFGESFIKGERPPAPPEGYYTVKAMMQLAEKYGVDLPIARAVYRMLYEQGNAKEEFEILFSRKVTEEFR